MREIIIFFNTNSRTRGLLTELKIIFFKFLILLRSWSTFPHLTYFIQQIDSALRLEFLIHMLKKDILRYQTT